MALNVVAWLTSSYPLDASRVVAYATPAALVLIAAGIPPVWSWFRAWGKFAPVPLLALLLAPVALGALRTVRPWNRLDSAAPTAFVLGQRQPDEPVVGIWWEQRYYCRELGPLYRDLVTLPTEPPSPLPAAGAIGECVQSLWLLSSHDPVEQQAHLAQLRPSANWRMAAAYPFRDVVVLHVRR